MTLTAEQSDAITSPQSLVVIASAGTGKTRVLTERFLHLYQQQNVALAHILAITFTEKAAAEMEQRLLRTGGLSAVQLAECSIGTIHAFCLRLIKRHADVLGIHSDIKIQDPLLAEIERERFVSEALKSRLASGDPILKRMTSRYGVRSVRQSLDALLAMDLLALPEAELRCLNTSDELPFGGKVNDAPTELLTPFLKLACKLQTELRQQRFMRGLLHFDDFEPLILRLFSEKPDVLKDVRLRYQHVLVDEVQDISAVQERLIRALFHPEQNKLFIVGDPKQAIYGFRKADPRCFESLGKTILDHGGRQIILTQTFRTPPSIQAAFNRLFPLLLDASSPTPFTSMVSAMTTDTAEIRIVPPRTDLTGTAASCQAMAPDIILRIQNLLAQSVFPSDIAILSGAHSRLAFFAAQLREAGIAVHRETQLPLLEDPVVSVTLQILLYLAGVSDRIGQVAILRSRCLALSDGFIESLLKSVTEDLFTGQTMDLFANAHDREVWALLTAVLREAKELLPVFSGEEMARHIYARLSLSKYDLLKWPFNALIDFMQQAQHAFFYTLVEQRDSLQRLLHTGVTVPATAGDPEGVALFTIHGAKGLEFEHVFLVPGSRDPSSSDFWIYQSERGFAFKTPELTSHFGLRISTTDNNTTTEIKKSAVVADTAEVRRLMYVALTRTRQSLHIYPQAPAKNLIKLLEKSPRDTIALKNYDHWLYWISLNLSPVVTTNPDRLLLARATPDTERDNQTSTIVTVHTKPPQPTSLPTYSVTQLEIFQQCPKRYELQFVNGISPMSTEPQPQTGKIRSRLSARDRGNLFHEILQFTHFLEEDNLDTVIEQALFNQRLTDPQGSIRTECRLFLQRLSQDPLLHPVMTSPRYTTEEEFMINTGTLLLHGKIDRLSRVRDKDSRGDEWMVLDYKTAVTLSDADRDARTREYAFQMSCYALAVAETRGQADVNTLVLFTSGPDWRLLRHRAADISAFRERLQSLSAKLNESCQTSAFPLTTDRSQCARCPYFRDNYCGVRD